MAATPDDRAERSSASIRQILEHGLPAGAKVGHFVSVPGQFRTTKGARTWPGYAITISAGLHFIR
jgi:hypothetical protein